MTAAYALFVTRNGREKHVDNFETVKDAAEYLYNTESDSDEEIATAWESGDFEGCIRGDFRLRAN